MEKPVQLSDSNDPFIGLAATARHLAVDGVVPHSSSVYRAMVDGVKRGQQVIRLRHVRFGRKLATKASWITEYLSELQEARAEEVENCGHRRRKPEPVTTIKPRSRTPEQKAAAIERASARLASAGV